MTWTQVVAAALAGVSVILTVNLTFLRWSRRRGFHAEPPSSYPSVSVIIPARNEAANLRRLLPSLLTQRYPDFDVFVFDDDSQDETWNVIASHASPRLRALRGAGPPPGWVGKVHALYRASGDATGELLLFLDADVELLHPDALEHLVRRYLDLPAGSVLSGITRLRGGGQLLVSMVPFTILTFLPVPLIGWVPSRRLSAMNGQCWLIGREDYRRLEPHLAHPSEVLEDVRIGQYLKGHGVIPYLRDLQAEVGVRMYEDHGAAWRGFRKNAYLFMGNAPWVFAATHGLYVALFILPPVASAWFLAWLYALKALSDRHIGAPWWVTVLSPVSFLAWAVLQWDSAIAHARGTVEWKGRTVSRIRDREARSSLSLDP